MRIYSDNIEMEFSIEKCPIMKSGKRQMTEGIEVPNQEKTRMLGGKETYKHLGILEAGTVKQIEMKENFFKKDTSRERKNYPKPNYIAEISSNGSIPSLSLS